MVGTYSILHTIENRLILHFFFSKLYTMIMLVNNINDQKLWHFYQNNMSSYDDNMINMISNHYTVFADHIDSF